MNQRIVATRTKSHDHNDRRISIAKHDETQQLPHSHTHIHTRGLVRSLDRDRVHLDLGQREVTEVGIGAGHEREAVLVLRHEIGVAQERAAELLVDVEGQVDAAAKGRSSRRQVIHGRAEVRMLDRRSSPAIDSYHQRGSVEPAVDPSIYRSSIDINIPECIAWADDPCRPRARTRTPSHREHSCPRPSTALYRPRTSIDTRHRYRYHIESASFHHVCERSRALDSRVRATSSIDCMSLDIYLSIHLYLYIYLDVHVQKPPQM